MESKHRNAYLLIAAVLFLFASIMFSHTGTAQGQDLPVPVPTVTITVPGPVETILKEVLVEVPGPTVTMPGPTVTVPGPTETVLVPVPGPTVTVTRRQPGPVVTVTKTAEPVIPSLAPQAPGEVAPTGQAAPRNATVGPAPTLTPQPERNGPIDLSIPEAIGIGTGLFLFGMAGGLLGIFLAYYRGYKDAEKAEARSLKSFRDDILGR